ncbi:protein cornichon homolog 4-like [Tripterygium wilfordii]|uniref:protein cornichon homolog 4-like n=1 Tax=Tripterygium wilfordii TaxID=458696 RepID=UPI0018F810EF|nr:protein cornichon homolog 4-like [Tripterygium wilfordii]
MGDLYVWLISFFFIIALIVMIVFQLMCLADLEFDYINPYDSSSRINKAVLPEYFTQGALCILYLITGHWCMALVCAPYLYYNVRLYTQKQHLVDVTEIFNQLHWEKKQRLFKLGYLIINLFLAIFWMIMTALEDHDDY